MSSLVMGTSAVSLDEPCYSLKELNLQSPRSRGWHRYQIITVIRDKGTAVNMGERWREKAQLFDLGLGYTLTEMRRDLGPAKKFTANQFTIPGGVTDTAHGRTRIELLHTVGELVDIANVLRSDAYDRPEAPKPSDLIQGYHDAADKQRRQRAKRSTFGELVRIQRS